MKKLKLLGWVLVMLFISACATSEGDKQDQGVDTTIAYHGWSAEELAAHPTVITCDGVQEVLPMPDNGAQLARPLFEQGYFICGFSLPQVGGKVRVMQQARTLGACRVYFAEHPQDVEAYYVVKLDPRNYGILTTDIMYGRRLQGGVFVAGLRNGGPGETAGLKPGDVLVKINGQEVVAHKTLDPYLYYGADNSLEINRQGQAMTLRMPLPALPD